MGVPPNHLSDRIFMDFPWNKPSNSEWDFHEINHPFQYHSIPICSMVLEYESQHLPLYKITQSCRFAYTSTMVRFLGIEMDGFFHGKFQSEKRDGLGHGTSEEKSWNDPYGSSATSWEDTYPLIMTNIAMENPYHKWKFIAGKIIYFPWLC